MVASGPEGERRLSTDGEASRKRCERRLTGDAKSPEPTVREPNKKTQNGKTMQRTETQNIQT